jgi:hypothetical protein
MWKLILVGCLLCTACGGDDRYAGAEHAVRLASRALVDVETSGGEDPDLQQALQESHDWLEPAETAIELWSEGGDVAFDRVAPCLGVALTSVRERLATLEREIPPSLEQAEAETLQASEEGCRR